MPKIGKRILKSSLAVFLCFVIYVLRSEEGIVFYSCIAAVLCVQQSARNTFKVARNRIEGTLIGGFIGMLVLLIENSVIPHEYNLLQYMFISLMIIPTIYITVILKKTSASYISCVVFMSITVSHAMDVNPFLFAMNRMLDTSIGIFVAMLVNGVALPIYRNKQNLWYVAFECIPHDEYSMIKWNQMIEQGAHISLLCNETPATLMKKTQHMNLSLPVIFFDGAFSYDINKQIFEYVTTFDEPTYTTLYRMLLAYDSTIFVSCIIHNVMHHYYSDLRGSDALEYYENKRKLPYENYVYGNKPKGVLPVCFMVLIEHDDVESVMQHLHERISNIHVIRNQYNENLTQLIVTMEPHESILLYMKSQLQCKTLIVIDDEEHETYTCMADHYYVVNKCDTLHVLGKQVHKIV